LRTSKGIIYLLEMGISTYCAEQKTPEIRWKMLTGRIGESRIIPTLRARESLCPIVRTARNFTCMSFSCTLVVRNALFFLTMQPILHRRSSTACPLFKSPTKSRYIGHQKLHAAAFTHADPFQIQTKKTQPKNKFTCKNKPKLVFRLDND